MELQIRVVTVLAIAVLAVMGTAAFALLSASQTIPNTGNISALGVGVYSDSDCSQEVTIIMWGTLDPGETSDEIVYICNEGNMAVVLSGRTENWNPASASSYITLTWNLGGSYVLDPGESVRTVFTLSISSSIIGVESFNFDIIITGTEST